MQVYQKKKRTVKLKRVYKYENREHGIWKLKTCKFPKNTILESMFYRDVKNIKAIDLGIFYNIKRDKMAKKIINK